MPRLLASIVPVLLATAVLLPGCQPAPKAVKPHSGADGAADKTTQTPQGVTVEDEDGKARIRFVGVKGRHGKGADVFLLRSWLIRTTRLVTHQVYVTDRYVASTARGWNAATGPKGEKLRVTKIETKTETCSPDGCPRTEAYGAAIDDVTLRAARDKGYAVNFTSESGAKETVTITPEQIAAQLASIDQKLASLPPAKPAAAKKRAPAQTDGTTTPTDKPSGAGKTHSKEPMNSGY